VIGELEHKVKQANISFVMLNYTRQSLHNHRYRLFTTKQNWANRKLWRLYRGDEHAHRHSLCLSL